MHTTTGNTILTLDEERKEKLTQKNPKRATNHRKGKKSVSNEFQLDFSLNYYCKTSRSMLLMDPISHMGHSGVTYYLIEIFKKIAYKVGKVINGLLY